MRNTGITDVLAKIYEHLPLHAEEGGDACAINMQDCLTGADFEGLHVSTAIALVERLFISMGVLDESLLEHGIWRFKSFPASLMGRSVLAFLKDNDQSVFANGFWGGQNDHSGAAEEQRKVLDYLESQRHKHHPKEAQPIRKVHVAWGFIYVNGRFLLRHREDKSRDNESNYVLVGGKLSQHDLMEADKTLSAIDAVRLLQRSEASNNRQGIEIALDREMSEETGLQNNVHYTYSHWRTLKPYTNLGGAGAVRAVTQYHIHVYQIALNQDGVLALFNRVREDSNLVWFSKEELINAKSHDGKMAYIPALIEHFESIEAWENAISHLPESYNEPAIELSDAFSVTVPLDSQVPVQIGKTGKEKPLYCNLTKEEHAVLLSLSIFAKDPSAEAKTEAIQTLYNGWIEFVDDAQKVVVRALANKLQESEILIIEGYKERYYRLALTEDRIYFQNGAFRYHLEDSSDKKTQLVVTRERLATELIESSATSYSKEIAGALKVGLKELMAGRDVGGEDQKDLDTFRKNIQRLAPMNQKIGLRGLIRSVDSNFKLVIAAK
ncbi:MAG: hypothetical protein C9356_09340 [Oleiphilus sp.]|nr:MAG: hypothetical protein C9356_09340 [Oleiphilus sp.]